ncbi:hypothetical protein [Bacillus solitudinis]|uniref:hypothetical protein n=1 Tax=Bacillus solitudinis TaxID=2014074 RepID=UPI000C23C875|nr:hypothetical protein [Bacillus solitudinis]
MKLVTYSIGTDYRLAAQEDQMIIDLKLSKQSHLLHSTTIIFNRKDIQQQVHFFNILSDKLYFKFFTIYSHKNTPES